MEPRNNSASVSKERAVVMVLLSLVIGWEWGSAAIAAAGSDARASRAYHPDTLGYDKSRLRLHDDVVKIPIVAERPTRQCGAPIEEGLAPVKGGNIGNR